MKRIFCFMIPFLLTGCSAKNYSVSVIGGADGPTSITVSRGLNPWMIGALIVIAVAAAVTIVLRRKHKK